MQRGIVLQYDEKGGVGRVITDGVLYLFTCKQWQGSVPPDKNTIVDLNLQDQVLLTLKAVPQAQLLQEQAERLQRAEISSNFTEHTGLRFEKLSNRPLGWPTVAAQILFIFSLFKLPALSLEILWFRGSVTFYELLRNPLIQTPPLFVILVYLSCLSIALPYFIRRRHGWLTMALPLVAVGGISLLFLHQFQQYLPTSDTLMGFHTEDLWTVFRLKEGFYALVGSALFLALRGIYEFLTQR